MTGPKKDLWSTWTKSLPAASRQLFDVPTTDDVEGDAEFEAFRGALGSFGDKLGPCDAASMSSEKPPRYGMIECWNGAWPVLRVFVNPYDMAKRLGAIDGQDVVVWAFWGSEIVFTEGPLRYLILPDGTSLTVPRYQGMKIQRVDSSLVAGVSLQGDGFLGPPELARPAGIAEQLEADFKPDYDDDDPPPAPTQRKRKRKKSDDVDDDDADDDEEDAAAK